MSTDHTSAKPPPTAGRPLATKLAKIAAELPDFEKDGRNSHQGYEYLSAAKLFSELRKRLGEAGIAIIPTVKDWTTAVGTTATNKPTNVVTGEFCYLFVDGETGDSYLTSFVTQAMDSGDKAFSKAATQSLKYVVRQMFLVADNGDDLEAEVELKTPVSEVPIPANVKAAVIPSQAPSGGQVISEAQSKLIARSYAERYKQVHQTDEVDWKPLNEIISQLGAKRTNELPRDQMDNALALVAAYGNAQPAATVVEEGQDDIPF